MKTALIGILAILGCGMGAAACSADHGAPSSDGLDVESSSQALESKRAVTAAALGALDGKTDGMEREGDNPDGKVEPGKDPDETYRKMEDPDRTWLPSEDPDTQYKPMESPDDDPKALAKEGKETLKSFVKEARIIAKGKIDEEKRDGNGGTKGMKASQYWELSMISRSKARLDWHITDYNLGLAACWKKSGTFSLFICNQNAQDITEGEPGVVYEGVDSGGKHHFSTVITGLDCETKYKFHMDAGSWQFGSDQKGTTLGCDICDWDDSIAAFGGSYVTQGSILENTSETCRVHRGDFNGDGKTDILRSCNDPNYNAVWYGAASGFSGGGYVITGSILQNTADTCRLHIGDFDGNGTSDLLRTCDNPSYNARWFGSTSGGFVGGSYVFTGSVLQNSSNSCRLHLGNFNGTGGTDLLRSCNDPNYNALLYGTAGGFVSAGYVLTGSVLENSSNSCRLHVGDYNADGKTDLLRSCNDPNYNAMLYGASSGFASGGYVLTGSILEYSNDACRLHVANFDGASGSDLLRTCDNPAYNALLHGTPGGFVGAGYVFTTSQLQNSAKTCVIHLGDYDGDGKSDFFRTCDDHCYNALVLGTSSSFVSMGYVLTGSDIHSSTGCRIHVANYDGDVGSEVLRTCDNPFYNALFISLL